MVELLDMRLVVIELLVGVDLGGDVVDRLDGEGVLVEQIADIVGVAAVRGREEEEQRIAQ